MTRKQVLRSALVLWGALLVSGLSTCNLFGSEDDALIVGSGFQSSIQAAIDAAVDGDEIIVLPGRYKESFNLNGKNITVRSATRQELDDMDYEYPVDPEDFDIPAETVIDGDGADAVIALDSGQERDAVIHGLTITGGGMGIYIRKGSQAVITDNIIEANSAGGIHLIAGSTNADASDTPAKAEIRGNTIRSNVASVGAGIYLGYFSEAIIEENIFSDNTAAKTSAPRGGGAIGVYTHYSHNTSNVIHNNLIRNNTAYRAGGGISLTGSGITTTITENEFAGNVANQDGQQAQASGGGIHIDSCQKVTIKNNTLNDNTAYWRGGAMVVLEGKTYGDDATLMTYENYAGFNSFANNTVLDSDYPESFDLYIDS